MVRQPDLLPTSSVFAPFAPTFHPAARGLSIRRRRVVSSLNWRNVRDLLAFLLQLRELGRVVRGRALGIEALLGFLLERREAPTRTSPRRVAASPAPPWSWRRLPARVAERVVRRAVLAVATVDLHVEPARDVEELARHSSESWLVIGRRGCAAWLPAFRMRMELVLNDLGHRLAERLRAHQVVQVVGEGRAKPVALVDRGDGLLDEATLLDERARRVLVRIPLGEPRQIGQHRALWRAGTRNSRDFMFELLHERAMHGALFNDCAISSAPCTSSSQFVRVW